MSEIEPKAVPTSGSGAEPTRSPGRRRSARVPLGALAIAIAAVVVVRTGVLEAPGAPLPPSAPVVDVTLSDYRYDYEKPTEPGRTVFSVRNAGGVGHRFSIAPLPEDMPPIDEQLRGEVRRTIDFIVDIPQVQEELPPRGTLTVAVDLQPGQRYAFLCLLATPENQTHAELGLNTEFRMAGTPPAPSTTAKPPGP